MTTGRPPTPDDAAIVGRWEWRTFGGGDLSAAIGIIDSRAPEGVEDSEEIYFLSAHADAPVKLRRGLMDVKRRDRADEHGLELWQPVLKSQFPLVGDDLGTTLSALGMAAPAGLTEIASADAFIDAFATPGGDVRVAKVHKHRRHYLLQECMVEWTRLVVDDDHETETIVVESPDAEQVWSTVRSLGLDDRPNENIVVGLKKVLGVFRRAAVIDIGTNSVKFHLGEVEADGAERTVTDRAEVTRLGEGMEATGRFAPAAMERTTTAIASMVHEARRAGAADLAAVGTAGLRIASNAGELLDIVRARCGVTIEIISGEEEARLAYRGATESLPTTTGRRVVFDSGGGSSQFTFGTDARIEQRFSVNVGAVTVTEAHRLDGVVSEAQVADALATIAIELGQLQSSTPPEAVVGMGGTATNLAAVALGLARYDPEVINGAIVDVPEIDRQIELYRTSDAEARRTIVGLQANRAAVILGGACIVRTILDQLGQTRFTVSDRGLRHGLFTERFGRAST
jgi:exopolyphosphatase / guanosine-5'-triphosphate,3'-diphosphate pyrophosphatase